MVIADVNQVNQTGNECYQSHLVAEAADTCLLSSAAVVCNVDTRLMEITDANTPEVDVTRASSPSAANMLCTQCGKEFYTRQELFQHVKIAHQQHAHAARRMFKCEQCMKSFKTMTALRNHARTHQSYFDPSLNNFSLYSSEASFVRNSTAISGDSSHTLSCDITRISSNEATFTILDISDVTLPSPDASSSTEADKDRTLVASTGESDDKTLKIVDGTKENVPCNESNQKLRRKSAIPVRIGSSLEKHSINSPLTTSSENQDLVMTKTKTSTPVNRLKPAQSTPNVRSKTCDVISGESVKPVTPRKAPATPARNTPIRQTKTPLKQTGTPLRQKGTPLRQKTTSSATKKTPVRQKETPISEKKKLRSHNSTPRNKREVLSASKRTPRSCSKTPNGTQYKCQKCGQSFVDKARLEVHFALHVRDTPDKCGIPKKVIKRKILTSQLSAAGSPSQRKYECSQCGRSYDQSHLLTAHMKVHSVDTPYRCEFCSKSFKYLSSLKAHSYVHRGEKPTGDVTSVPEVLRKTRSSSKVSKNLTSVVKKGQGMVIGSMSNIFSIFSDVFPASDDIENDAVFSCKNCDFKSKFPADLLLHLKTHSRVGPYKCATCSKSYKLQNNLKMHEKMHAIQRLKQVLVVKSRSNAKINK